MCTASSMQNKAVCIRQGKLNSQFIVRLFDFACGWAVIIHSDFKLVKNEVAIAKATPFNCSAQGVGAKLFIHVGGDNKLRIQFAWPGPIIIIFAVLISKIEIDTS